MNRPKTDYPISRLTLLKIRRGNRHRPQERSGFRRYRARWNEHLLLLTYRQDHPDNVPGRVKPMSTPHMYGMDCHRAIQSRIRRKPNGVRYILPAKSRNVNLVQKRWPLDQH